MIKINLLGDDTVIDTSGIWLVLGYGLSMVSVLVACVLIRANLSAKVDELTVEQANLQHQLDDLKKKTKLVNELEAKKKELADKTEVIATLKRNKIGPVRVMDDLNMALPEKSWLVEFRESSNLMRINGLALDNQTIASFMRSLEKSPYFGDIGLDQSRQVDRNGVHMKEFVIQAPVSYAGLAKKTKRSEEDPAAKARVESSFIANQLPVEVQSQQTEVGSR